ncbi:MAG: hypothetical protein ACYC2H_10285 [Thermoplasmatota archaeon]
MMLALLVAAALAGCTGGTSGEGQLPEAAPSGTVSGSQTRSNPRTQAADQGGGDRKSYDASLEVSPENGTAPLNVTLTFGATWRHNGQRAGPGGNGTSGNTNGTDGRGGTPNDGWHPVNGGHDVNWTLEVRWMGPPPLSTGTGTGNQTGNGTSSSNSTTGAPAGTGNGTGGTGNGTMANGTVVASFNGTAADLPGNESVLLNETGSYNVTFTVTPADGESIVRYASITVEPLPPGSPLGNETRTFEGSFLASEPLLCFGSAEHEWILNATFGGTPAEVSHLNLTVETAGFADVELTLVAPNGTEIGSGPEIDAEGPFGAGNYTLTAESCVAADAEYTVTAIAHYVTRTA